MSGLKVAKIFRKSAWGVVRNLQNWVIWGVLLVLLWEHSLHSGFGRTHWKTRKKVKRRHLHVCLVEVLGTFHAPFLAIFLRSGLKLCMCMASDTWQGNNTITNATTTKQQQQQQQHNNCNNNNNIITTSTRTMEQQHNNITTNSNNNSIMALARTTTTTATMWPTNMSTTKTANNTTKTTTITKTITKTMTLAKYRNKKTAAETKTKNRNNSHLSHHSSSVIFWGGGFASPQPPSFYEDQRKNKTLEQAQRPPKQLSTFGVLFLIIFAT